MRDVIVIGAGAGGSVVAKELAARGLDVLVVEGGPRHADPRRQWSLLENDAWNPVDGYLRAGPADRSKPAWYRETPQNSFLWQVTGVGGTTLHYFGNSPRAYPGVFQGYAGADKAAYDVAHRFPFAYRDLVPYYEWVEATLPVETAAMGTKESVYFRGCETLGIPVQTDKTTKVASYRPQENAILQPGGKAGRTLDLTELRYPTSTGCTFCGHCIQGCVEPIAAPRNLVARRSADNSYIPMALTAGAWSSGGKAITLVADASVTQVHTGQVDGRFAATGVSWRENGTGQVFREDARVVVMAGGATETPRLWFNSALPNPNDWVGRGFTDHALDWVFGLFNEDTGSSRGPNSGARTDYPGHGSLQNVGWGPALQSLLMNVSDSGVRGAYTNGRGITGAWDGPTGRLVGDELKEAMLHGVDRMLNVLVTTDDDVQPDNRITLSGLPGDANGGVPRARIDHRARSARTTGNREFLADRAVRLLRGAGATKVYRIDLPPVMLHVHSTMRMGVSDADSVLDQSAETRAVARLFVADNSALPNSLGGPNPTLTNQALATRTAEKIFERYFGGNGWVRSEAPVVSTDQRVTRRLAESGL